MNLWPPLALAALSHYFVLAYRARHLVGVLGQDLGRAAVGSVRDDELPALRRALELAHELPEVLLPRRV